MYTHRRHKELFKTNGYSFTPVYDYEPITGVLVMQQKLAGSLATQPRRSKAVESVAILTDGSIAKSIYLPKALSTLTILAAHDSQKAEETNIHQRTSCHLRRVTLDGGVSTRIAHAQI